MGCIREKKRCISDTLYYTNAALVLPDLNARGLILGST